MNVSLTAELQAFVESQVETGRYQTASEVVSEGLMLLEAREQEREALLEELREKLRRSGEQARRGELIKGSVVFERLQEMSARRRAETK